MVGRRTSEDSSLPALLPLTVCVVPEQCLLSFSDTLIVRVTYLLTRLRTENSCVITGMLTDATLLYELECGPIMEL